MSTCTAPDHPDCTITCPNGCGAIYVEPDGPCHTFCSDSFLGDISVEDAALFSICIRDLPFSRLAAIFGKQIPSLLGKTSENPVTFLLKSATLADLERELEGFS